MNDYSPQQIASIALDLPLWQQYDYLVPADWLLEAGQRVRVPFGHREAVGVVVQIFSAIPEQPLKTIVALLDEVPVLDAPILALAHFMAQYYHRPLGQVLFTMLPIGLRQCRVSKIQPVESAVCLTESAPPLASLPKRQQGLIQLLAIFPAPFLPISRPLALATGTQAAKWLRYALAEGWLATCVLPPPIVSEQVPPTLHHEQAAAVAAIQAAQAFSVFLLHGITGSGKTEVYLQSMAQYVTHGGQCLLLVPEINLTPQLVERVQARFPLACIALLNSRLAESERTQHWLNAAQGRAQIVLGTRMAILCPMPNLRLIIVDEEHDSAYKQQEGVRYSARDVAIYRARLQKVAIVLGSATPSLESHYNQQQGRYVYLPLRHRAVQSAQLPQIELLDMRRRPAVDGLAEPTIAALQTEISTGGQALVFLNRRGYAPVLACTACGWLSACKRCSGHLVWHRHLSELHCHLCGWRCRVPMQCPSCGNVDLQGLGQGTQRIEARLNHLFPDVKIARVDADSTRRKGSWDTLYPEIVARTYPILVGTQMLSKGHDFPALGLVVVVNADAGLYSADFRSSERLFAQLWQVAGRAGRGARAGKVIIQTQLPDHPLFHFLRKHDERGFLDFVLAERQAAGFPPYAYQAILRAESVDEILLFDFLTQAAQWQRLERTSLGIEMFDPTNALVARVENKHRAYILLQSTQRAILQRFLNQWRGFLMQQKNTKVRWYLDIDPIDF